MAFSPLNCGRFSVRLATLWQPTQEALLQAGALKRSKEDEQNNGTNNSSAPKRKNLGLIGFPGGLGVSSILKYILELPPTQ